MYVHTRSYPTHLENPRQLLVLSVLRYKALSKTFLILHVRNINPEYKESLLIYGLASNGLLISSHSTLFASKAAAYRPNSMSFLTASTSTQKVVAIKKWDATDCQG